MPSELYLNGPAWLSLLIQHSQHESHTLDGMESSKEQELIPCLTVAGVSHSSEFLFNR